MKLTEPTDYEILQALKDHGRNTAANIALLIDKNRQYINTRLASMNGTDLIIQIGPAENSGLYEITDQGETILSYYENNGPINGNHTQIFDHHH